MPREAMGGALFGEGGHLERARGGTLFVDEIGNVPLDLQERLRNLLVARASDVRLVVATRRDLDRDVAEGTFDEALLALLVAGRVELPPLRARSGDVPVLAAAFHAELGGVGALPEDFLPRFEHYAWPGNVQELKNAVLARMTMGELGVWKPVLPEPRDYIDAVVHADLPFSRARSLVADEFERRYVARVLFLHDGNVTRAAQASGVAHRYFQVIRARTR